MLINKKIGLSVGGFLVVGLVAYWIFKPYSYNDCILDNMPGTASDKAARAIATSCKKLYSKQQ